jgi:hypothetical protein
MSGHRSFGLVFLLGGLAIVSGIWGPGVASMLKARSWQPTESEVVLADVGISERGDQQSPLPLVVYAYRAGGRERMATRLDFFAIRHFSEASARAFAARYPAGSRVPCFVDPADPDQAVLRRYALPLDWVNGVLALMATAFITIGVTEIVPSRQS